MTLHKLERTQLLKITMDEAWEFFSTPRNLNEITPPNLRFEITSGADTDMYAGQIITYRIELFPGIKQNWITEITTVEERTFFVDEQRFGPYKFWHHKHFFEEKENGVLVTDVVHYALPFGILGSIAHGLLVKERLKQIFDFRYNYLHDKFNI